MRRLILSTGALILAGIILGISLWRTQVSFVSIASEEASYESEVSTESAQSVAPEEEEYSLPYPGILPDHPLYFIKMIRDRVQLIFIRDPLAKAELMQHYASKRFAAALSLAESGKFGLAVSTSMKAAYYMERALNEAEMASSQGKDVINFYDASLSVIKKHGAVLAGIESRIPSEAQGGLGDALATNKRNLERVMEIKGVEMSGSQEMGKMEESMEPVSEEEATASQQEVE